MDPWSGPRPRRTKWVRGCAWRTRDGAPGANTPLFGQPGVGARVGERPGIQGASDAPEKGRIDTLVLQDCPDGFGDGDNPIEQTVLGGHGPLRLRVVHASGHDHGDAGPTRAEPTEEVGASSGMEMDQVRLFPGDQRPEPGRKAEIRFPGQGKGVNR